MLPTLLKTIVERRGREYIVATRISNLDGHITEVHALIGRGNRIPPRDSKLKLHYGDLELVRVYADALAASVGHWGVVNDWSLGHGRTIHLEVTTSRQHES